MSNIDRSPPMIPSVSASAAADEVASSASSGLACVWMLARREWIRFFRQRNRVIGALGQPILFWLLFGTGMHSAFQGGSQDFMSFYLPGTIALILLFTAIFATISIIEDRKEGFLQNVLVAPVPRWTIAAGKILGGSAIAWVQAVLFVALTVAIGSVSLSWNLLPLLLLMALAAAAMTALGVFFAWPMDSTQGFHAIMNLVLMPLWLLSGAFFPVPVPNSASPVGQLLMHWIMRLNPLSYTIAGMRHLILPQPISGGLLWLPAPWLCWFVTIVFLSITVGAAWFVVCHRTQADLA